MNKLEAGRLAFRVEGDMWNCYYADMDTMKDAQLLGSIRMSLARDKKIKDRFMAFMKSCFEQIVKDATNSRVESWSKTREAPFWEKQ